MRFILSLIAISLAGIAKAQAPVLDAKSAILIDAKTGVVLWEKDSHAIRYPASTTKILSAILLLEHTEPGDLISAPDDTETVEGASLHLKPGETITAADLLKSMLLRSANDACHALAVHVSGSDLEFAKLMNQKAKDLGCLHSHFMAPHGLHNDKHYTTAYDLALIAKHAMSYPEIREIVGIMKATIARSMNTQDILLISKNKWLEHDPSATGIKTGYTKVARATFVGSASRNGVELITVLLKGEKWEEDQRALINFGFSDFKSSVVLPNGTPIGEVPIANGEKKTVAAVCNQDVAYSHAKSAKPSLQIKIEPRPNLTAPIEKGTVIGSAVISDGKGWSAAIEIYASESIKIAPATLAMRYFFGIGALALGGASIAMRRKSRKWATNGFGK
jgi:D-alanyl-D-alanine carboxypeptidase (penicillin-binding protein 5/6)